MLLTVGPYVARGPVGSYGMLSLCDSDQHVPDGPVGPSITRGLVGSYGMLSPCDSDFDPEQPVADGPVGPYVTRGPVGSYGIPSPCDSDFDPDQPVADGLVGPSATRGPVGSYVMSSPCNSDTPGPAGQYVADGPVVAVVDQKAGSIVTDVSSDGVYDSEAWDSGYQREIIDGVTVYYGGDLCDSEESDWEDAEDVARREYVEQYNFDLLEGMKPMVFVPGGIPSRADRRDEDGIYLYDGDDARVSCDDSIVDRERKTWREYCASLFREGLGPFPSDAAVSPPMGVPPPVGTNCVRRRIGRIRNPPEHHIDVRDIARAPTSVSDEDEDWSDTSISSHVEVPVLAFNFLKMNERLKSRDFL